MTPEKLRPTTLDTTLAALAPVLIITMIGSLVYFLLIALYQGDYPARLMWVLGLFTIASVLITRIAIEQSRAQSLVYLGLLAGATLLVAPRYFVVEGALAPLSFPILVAFLGLIAYLADRITMDCTSVDRAESAHGEGLLQTLGILRSSQPQAGNSESKKREREKSHSDLRRHNPGVWILYFSLMALPLFGLGQFAIHDSGSRRAALLATLMFLASSLSLLVVISLLALRQYVRRRDIAMSGTLASHWLIAGWIAVAILVGAMAILPLPMLDSSASAWPFRISSRTDLKSSRWGWGSEGVGSDPSQNAPDQKPSASGPPSSDGTASSNGQPSPSGQPSPNGAASSNQGSASGGKPSNAGNSASQGSSSQGASSQGSSSQGASSSSQGSSQGAPDSRPETPRSGQSQSANKPPGGEAPPSHSPPDASANREKVSGDTRRNPGQKGREDASSEPRGDAQEKASERPREGTNARPSERAANPPQPAAATPPPPPPSANFLEWNLGATLRWLLILGLLAIVVIFGWRYRRDVLSYLREWWGAWSRWFGRNNDATVADAEVDENVEVVRAFSSLPNPFLAHAGDPDAIIRELFSAAVLWGKEHRVTRRDEETPEEYLRRLGRKYGDAAEPFLQLGLIYCRLAYAQRRATAQEVASLRTLWEWMVAHAHRPSQTTAILGSATPTHQHSPAT